MVIPGYKPSLPCTRQMLSMFYQLVSIDNVFKAITSSEGAIKTANMLANVKIFLHRYQSYAHHTEAIIMSHVLYTRQQVEWDVTRLVCEQGS